MIADARTNSSDGGRSLGASAKAAGFDFNEGDAMKLALRSKREVV